MEKDDLIMEEAAPELDILEREDRCRKILKTVSKAIFMRIVVACLLIWVAFQSGLDLWIMGLMTLILVINLTGILPLFAEWKKRRKELKQIIAEYDEE